MGAGVVGRRTVHVLAVVAEGTDQSAGSRQMGGKDMSDVGSLILSIIALAVSLIALIEALLMQPRR